MGLSGSGDCGWLESGLGKGRGTRRGRRELGGVGCNDVSGGKGF